MRRKIDNWPNSDHERFEAYSQRPGIDRQFNMLELLLENVGVDAVVSLGDPALWKQAIDERLKSSPGQNSS
jgi:hypothetical protein